MCIRDRNKPIGIFLLLWPTLWALWLASAGQPQMFIVGIFIVGVILMRSAGCIINDIADRNFDGHVERTRNRPLAAGKISVKTALVLFFILIICAFVCVLQLNRFTILLSFVGAALAVIYPFMKRFTHLPQVGLGFAFAWGVPMAFAAETSAIAPDAWLLFSAAVLWPILYDTLYAMADREDDIKIGVKSTAILFGEWDRAIVGILQILFLCVLAAVGYYFNLQSIYFLSLFIAAGFFIYQQFLIKNRDRKKCFQAFLNNHWVGLIIFVGIAASYGL